MAILKPDTTTTLGGVTVNEYLLTKHNPNGIAMPVDTIGMVAGVTIHNTPWITTASGTTPAEQYTRATVNGNMADVRVHYYVDDKGAWQNLPHNRAGWHAADGAGRGNRTTIAIECIMAGTNDERDQKSEDNTARLAASLLNQFGLGIERLYTHTHWLNVRDGIQGTTDQLNVKRHWYKTCPAYIIPHWSAFKAKVVSYLGELQAPKPVTQPAAPATFQTGDSVCLNAGAKDIYGKTASSLYAGAANPLTIREMKGMVCTLFKGNTPMYRIESAQLRHCTEVVAAPKFIPGVSKVKLKPGATWWGTRMVPPAWVFAGSYYLQEWNQATNRAVFGTTPRVQSNTVTGAVDIAYLQLV